MDRIRLDEVAERIAAWHNRHPLAQRISASHAHDIGEVVLPFVADARALAATPLPDLEPGRGLAAWCARCLKQRRRALLVPAFSERFIEALAPARVARWARRYGSLWSILPADAPRRTIASDTRIATRAAAEGKSQAIELHLLSAAVTVGDRQLRVLLGAGGQMLGARAYARPRVAAAGVACTALVALAVAIGLPGINRSHSLHAAAVGQAAASAASAVVAPSAPSAPSASAAMAATAASAATAAASHAVAAASALPAEHASSASATEAARPAERSAATAAESPDRRPPPASIRPTLSDEEKRVAIETGQRLREAARQRQAPADAASTNAGAAPVSTLDHPVYALVAPPTRQREESVALLGRGQALQAMDMAPARRDVFATRGMWRAAFWPFESLADAERARIVLAGKGLKAEVVEF